VRIAQVAPLLEAVPPPNYGGIERIVAYLTAEHVRLGHEVTLYASGDSVTEAELRCGAERGLRSDDRCADPLPHTLTMLHRVCEEAHEFDVVHFHTGFVHLPLACRTTVPSVTTAHDRLDLRDLRGMYQTFRASPFVSISAAQREPMRWLNWAATIYHGLPPDLYHRVDTPEPYLAFVGRLSREKGIEAAVQIAIRTEMPLRVAAKLGNEDRAYFQQVIRKLFEHPLVEYVGEISDAEKQRFLGNATATLFPIDWPEPFGLVMIESMACGTPVIAFPRGSVPEVVDHGATGLIVESIEQAVEAVRLVERLSRRRCREVFEERFTTRRMAEEYLAVYGRLQEERHHHRRERPDQRPRRPRRSRPQRPTR
jgi:glycosyltransferase involved in cell wall biosynthesis